MNMQNGAPDPQQLMMPAPTLPFDTTAPETNAMHTSEPPARKRPTTTSHNLGIFEPRLFALMPESIAKELISLMRLILTQGGRKKHLLDMRRLKIRDLLQKLGNVELNRVYNEFATAHEQFEKRLSFKLPLIEDTEGGEEEMKEIEEANNDFGSHGARKETVEERGATDGTMRERAELGVTEDPDVDMEDILSTTLQVPTTHDVNSETAPSPSAPESQPLLLMPVGVACEKHVNDNCTVVPIRNPEAFPKMNIQEIQAQYYPFARMLDMLIHRDENDHVTQVTAAVDKGPVNYLTINDSRIITFLGLRQPPYDTICLQPNPRIDETYQIHIQAGQASQNPKACIVGELVSARHAYLYWLDSRQTADPKAPPTAAEARILAPKIGRRAGDTWREIEKCWKWEQGSSGRGYRENRMEYLGEDPTYDEQGERRSRRSMWV